VNVRLFFCIAMGVFTTLLGMVMLFAQLTAKPRPPLPPDPNFSLRQAAFTDPKTGEKMVYQEITVSTKFSNPPPPLAPPEKPVFPLQALEESAAKQP
jgi:hypothetical protein